MTHLDAGLLIGGLAAGAAIAAGTGRLDGARLTSPARWTLVLGGCLAIAGWSIFAADGWRAAVITVFGCWLLLTALVDAEHLWLPNALTLPLGAAGLILAALEGQDRLIGAGLGAAAGFGLLWLLAWGYRRLRGREGLGAGDPRLLGALGAWVGWAGLPSVLLWASGAGLSWVLARALLSRPVSPTDRLAFGTFLCTGGWLTFVLGPLGVQS